MANSFLTAAIVAATLLTAQAAAAETITFGATLSPKNEVPPIESPASGAAEMTLDTASRELSWTVTFDKLSAPVRAAHFHGAASATQNAPVLVPIAPRDATSPLKGSRVLTAEQMAELMSGRWYINIHTATHPPGELRGQVVRR